ncbi:MAG: hypothetical protein GDA36_11750 [Rhodobacteraceae bacterium]|nr:hypothetical protein [Paracoccaceae bacterium]
MFSRNFDLAILSGPMALPGLTSGKAVLVVWVYAIAGACRLRMILFAGLLRSARLPPSPVGRFVLASPNYRAVLHRAKAVLNPSSGVWRSACPRVFPGHAGVDLG